MNVPKRNLMRGFTIIEVVLVLAIAGLIFLMIFIALPALQRNQADSQRRSDVGRVVSQITQYQTDNRGDIPTAATLTQFKNDYLKGNGETFNDPDGDEYALVFKSGATDGTTDPGSNPAQMFYHSGAKCGAAGSAVASTSRKVAVRVKLAGGAVYCQNN